jgi:RNA polymerase sigma-70 factor (ECF subfamily)
VITRADSNEEADAVLADSIGLALLVVLESLEPAERLAFVLHDVLGVTFDEIAPIVGRSPVAARRSRAARAGVSRARLRILMIYRDNDTSWKRFLRRYATVTSNAWSPSSIRKLC